MSTNAQIFNIERTEKRVVDSMTYIMENVELGHEEGHSKRVAEYTSVLLHVMLERGMYPEFLTKKYIDTIYRGAVLHDIGKVWIQTDILHKPGKLNETEWQFMHSHPVLGAKTLEYASMLFGQEVIPHDAKDMALRHHEKWNGKGYPDGMEGTDIPFAARVLTIADVYDALTSSRPYKEAMPHKQVCEILLADRGLAFDPDILDVFMSANEEFHERWKEMRDQPDVYFSTTKVAHAPSPLAPKPAHDEGPLEKKAAPPNVHWEYNGVLDMADTVPIGDPVPLERCACCGRESLRYVHILTDPQTREEKHVGCVCAAKMLGLSSTSELKECERQMRKRGERRQQFFDQKWSRRANGNFVLKYKNQTITITWNKIGSNGGWGVLCNGKSCWTYNDEPIKDLNTAKLVAFNLFDAENEATQKNHNHKKERIG